MLIRKSKEGSLNIVIYRRKVNYQARGNSFTLMAQFGSKGVNFNPVAIPLQKNCPSSDHIHLYL